MNTTERNAEIRRRIEAGESSTVIGQDYGISRQRVCQIAKPVLDERWEQALARRPLDEFWAQVRVRGVTECWDWLGELTPEGYGKFQYGGTQRAHRLAYILERGPIPDGFILAHECHRKICVSPRHLRISTVLENSLDTDVCTVPLELWHDYRQLLLDGVPRNEARRMLGICQKCGNRTGHRMIHCEAHAIWQRTFQATRLQKRIDRGVCIRCLAPAANGHIHCDQHHAELLVKSRRHYHSHKK